MNTPTYAQAMTYLQLLVMAPAAELQRQAEQDGLAFPFDGDTIAIHRGAVRNDRR